MDEPRAPLDLDKVVVCATCEEAVVKIYAASHLAIDLVHPAEKAHLQMLSARPGPDAGLADICKGCLECLLAIPLLALQFLSIKQDEAWLLRGF